MMQNQDPEIQAKLMAMQKKMASKTGTPLPSVSTTASALQSRLNTSQLQQLQQRKLAAQQSADTDTGSSRGKTRVMTTGSGLVFNDCFPSNI